MALLTGCDNETYRSTSSQTEIGQITENKMFDDWTDIDFTSKINDHLPDTRLDLPNKTYSTLGTNQNRKSIQLEFDAAQDEVVHDAIQKVFRNLISDYGFEWMLTNNSFDTGNFIHRVSTEYKNNAGAPGQMECLLVRNNEEKTTVVFSITKIPHE